MRRTHALVLLLAVAFLLAGCRSGTTTPPVGLELDATVGTVAGVCATTDELTLADAPVHTVFYCYTITNTGERAIPLHDLTDDVNGSLLREFAFELQPGASISTVAAGVTISVDLSETTTNTATWYGFVGSNRVASATASTTVTVIPPATGLELVATVGTVAGVCATTDELTLADAAVHTVYYCYTVTNTGERAIPLHDLTDEVNGSLLREFAFDLEPGASISTVDAGMPISADLSETTTNVATWDGFVGSARVSSATASTTVTVIPPDTGLRLTATVGTAPGACAATASINLFDDVVPQTVYYCYTATNTGDVTLELHDLVDSVNGVIFRDLAFDLAPGAKIDTVAAGLTISAELDATTLNTGTWDSFGGVERLATGRASTSVTFGPRPTPRQYAAHVGTFVADSNGPTISPFAGNVVFLGIREFDGTPIAETVDVEITVPGYDPFTYTFDPALAQSGVLAFILADFTVELASVEARGLRYPVVTLPSREVVHASTVLTGTFSFAFPGQTLTVDVSPAGVLAIPIVTGVIVENGGLDLNVTFTDHGDPAVGYALEGFGRGPNAAYGEAVAVSSPAVVGLSFPLDVDEPFAVGVLAVRGPSVNPFSPPTSQVDAAEFLYYWPE